MSDIRENVTERMVTQVELREVFSHFCGIFLWELRYLSRSQELNNISNSYSARVEDGSTQTMAGVASFLKVKYFLYHCSVASVVCAVL